MGSCFFGGKIDRNNVSKGKNNLPKQLKDIKQLRLATVACQSPAVCSGGSIAGAYEPDSLDCLFSYEKRKIEFSLVLRKLKVPIPGDSNK
jgi:hypothetical protein